MHTGIAIIGMAGRFPKAHDLNAYRAFRGRSQPGPEEASDKDQLDDRTAMN